MQNAEQKLNTVMQKCVNTLCPEITKTTQDK